MRGGWGIPPTAAKLRDGVRAVTVGGPRRRKIGRIGGPTVGRGVRGKIKMFRPTVYKSIFMNFRVEFAKNRRNLYRPNSIYYCFPLEKPNLY